MTQGLVISAARSGAGKTTLTLGLLRALKNQGHAVQPFKCGPDYIDPAFHSAAAGRSSINLDSWAMDTGTLTALAAAADGADIAVAEGAMGLFDGVASPGRAGTGASADISAHFGWPVIAVLDCSGQAQTAAAVAKGLSAFRDDTKLAGVVLNNVASPRHERLVRDGMTRAGLKVFGALPRRNDISLPERHLGLVQAVEHDDLNARLEALSAVVAEHVDLEAVVQASASRSVGHASTSLPEPPGQRIALAKDHAFSFVYPHLLNHWRDAGAEILPFSPLADEGPSDLADVAWLPGGYPELHGPALAAAEAFRTGLSRFAETRPVHGECGGYMALGQGIEAKDGTRHQMVGLLGLETSFAKRKMHLGYRSATLLHPVPGVLRASVLLGHEFHFATVVQEKDEPLATVSDATGTLVEETGSCRGNVTGTFFHMIAGNA